ncbi:putative Nudix hydrolase YvcI [Parachlamydia acanthamoebae]|nr:putative Nudix hydrolase YvcI [Parachlamydia acanthamoebae]
MMQILKAKKSMGNMNLETHVYEEKPEGFSPKVEVAATYVIVDDKLLLLELAQGKQEPGFWGVPAGKIEFNETVVKGAFRELFEETGIQVSCESLFCSIGQLYIRKPEMDYTYHLFEIVLDKQPVIQLSSEHTRYKWVSKQDVEKLPLMKGAKKALDFYHTKRHLHLEM